ncbi:TonB-dependent receptor [Granulicella sp. WH15]|uniref:TonB-dependent receptor plug domain-containing protein n=1 Tax=Granulicella sp. WH15 TaxID=2602070 RepID=UPI0021045780|nr:TonB-dependent receptor [Granulicella sp. WH15]
MSIERTIGVALLAAGSITAQAQDSQQQQAIPPVHTSVVVLGNVTPVSEGESARTVVALDTQEHPEAYGSVEDYLRTDASIDIQERAPAGVLSDISVRGATFEQTLVLLNGLRMTNVETSHFNLDLPVPLAATGSMNVLHGAGSTVYGSDAIGGVVDVMTWQPEADTLRLDAGVGSYNENHQLFLASLVKRRWSEVLAGDRNFSTGFIADRDYRTEDLSSETRLKSALGATDLLLATDDRKFGAAQFFGDYNSRERTKGWFTGATQQFDEHTLAAFGYRRHTDIFLLEKDQPDGYKNQHIDNSFQGALRDSREIFKNTTLQTGLEETTEQINSTNLGQHGRNRGAGYGEVEWRVPGRGSLSAGLREEVFSGGRVVSSPMAAGTLWLPHSLRLKGSASYGFRLPTYLDLYYSDPTTLGNANLKPESAWSYELGLNWFPVPRLETTLTGFYSNQTNTIDYTRASSAQPWQASNLPGLAFKGLEGSLGWQASRGGVVKLSWTLLTGAQKALGGLQSEYVLNYPVNNGRTEYRWRSKQGILFDTRLGVVERYHHAPYAVWDASIAREAGRVHPYLRMTNLANTGYQEIDNVQMQGRSFVGGVELVLSRAKR